MVVLPALTYNDHLVGRSREGVSTAGLLAFCVNSGKAPQRP